MSAISSVCIAISLGCFLTKFFLLNRLGFLLLRIFLTETVSVLTFDIENVGVTPVTGPGIDTGDIGSGMILGYRALGGCPGLTAGMEETVGMISWMLLGYGTGMVDFLVKLLPVFTVRHICFLRVGIFVSLMFVFPSFVDGVPHRLFSLWNSVSLISNNNRLPVYRILKVLL